MAKRLLSTQRIVNLASDPASGTAGEIYYNTVSNSYKYYDGVAWVALAGGSGGLPSQSGNSGKFLTTNGTDASWAAVEALPSQTGNNGKYLTTNGTVASWSTVDADKLDGQDGSHYLDWTNTTNKPDPTITLGGDLSGSITLTDLAGGTLTATIAPNSVELGTDTVGQYIASVSGTTNQVNVSGSGTESITLTLSTPQDIHSGASPTFAGATLDSVRVGITATNEIDTSSGNLIIDSAGGTVTVDDNLTVSGNLTVNGTTTTVNSTTLTVDDPIITLGGDTAPSSDDGKDRGIEFRYYDTQARLGFMGYNDSTGEFTLLLNATNTNEVFSGTKATLNAHISGSNINAGTVSATYIDAAIARLASPALSGTPTAPTAAADTNTTQIATTAYVVGQGYLKSTTASSTYAPIASPTFTGTVTAATLDLTTAATTTAATSYWVETGSDGVVRPKTLANVRTEIVTTAAVNAAAATTVGTITSGTWQGSSISTTYTDAKVTSVNGSTGAVTGLATTAGKLSQFAATTSAELAGIISDETGSGALVFATSPTLTTPNIGAATGTSLTTTGNIIAGNGTGGVASTVNDGYGNANIAFNHAFGIPDVSGSSGRITVNVDSTTNASMIFQLKSNTSISTAVSLTSVLSLFETYSQFAGTIIAPAATTSLAPLRIPHGTAPSSPTNGDIWTTTAGVYARVNGSTVGPFGSASQEVYYQTTAPSSPATGTIWVDSDETVITLNSNDFALKNSPTFIGTVVLPTSASGGSSIRIPHGTAPSAPVNGDIWTTTLGLFGRINSTTQQFATVEYVNSSALDPFLLGGM